MRYLALILLFLSCSKEEHQTVEFHGIYAESHYGFKGEYVEIDINGTTIRRTVKEAKGGIVSLFFEVPQGWNEVTRVEVFEKGKVVYRALPIHELGSRNGLVTMGVPYTTNGNISIQIFEK